MKNLIGVCYLNEEGKILIAKGGFLGKKYALPIVDEKKDSEFANVNKKMKEEFGIHIETLEHLPMTNIFYKDKDEYLNANLMCLSTKEADNYPGKKQLVAEPVIFYDTKYVTYEELIELYDEGKVNNQTMYYARQRMVK